jgi:hypothetical protein
VTEQSNGGRFDFPDELDDTEDEDQPGPGQSERGGEDDDGITSAQLTGVSLFPGTDLSSEQARAIMAGSRCRVVVVAGMPRSGKTTLMAALYELFQRGPFAGYHFAGSRTQLGFDERCHRGRTASRRHEEDMERTLPGEVGFLHLAVRVEDGTQQTQHLLFTDISGETFRDDVRNSTLGTRALEVLRRADHFLLLIDAAALADLAQRQKALADARIIFESCLQEGMIGPRTHVQVAYARWDLTPKAGTPEEMQLRTFVERVVEPKFCAFKPRVASLSITPIAARPTGERLYLGYGVDALLNQWVEHTSLLRLPVPQVAIKEEHDREMIRLQWRVGPTEGA